MILAANGYGGWNAFVGISWIIYAVIVIAVEVFVPDIFIHRLVVSWRTVALSLPLPPSPPFLSPCPSLPSLPPLHSCLLTSSLGDKHPKNFIYHYNYILQAMQADSGSTIT